MGITLKFPMHRMASVVSCALLAGVSATVLAQTAGVQSLDAVVVTATGFDQSIKQAPASISVVTRQELEQKSYADLADALRDVEGIDVRGTTGKTGNLDISIRGMPSEYTLIMVDGRRQNAAGDVTPNGFGDTRTGFMPPLSAIERIEVIRGPMSTLYGSDAMGGVVNIITRKVAKEWGGSFGIESSIPQNSDAGNTNKSNLYVSGPLVDDLLGISLWGSIMRRAASDLKYDDGSAVSKRGPSPAKARTHTFGGKLSLTPNQDHHLWLELDQSRQWYDNQNCELGTIDGRNSSTCAVAPTYVANGYLDYMRFNRDQAAIGHSSRFSFGRVESSLMHSKTETIGRTIPTSTRSPNDPSIGTDRKLNTTNIVLDTKLIAPVGEQHILTVGGQYWQAKMEDSLVSDKYKQTTYALFAEDEWSLTDTLTATLGLRYDRHDAFGSHFSPRGYLVWNPTRQWTVKGGVSRGYLTPKLQDLHSGINSVGRQGATLGVGNPNLSPEVSTSTELGVSYDSLRGWTAGATLFHNKIKDKISSDGGRCSTTAISSCASGNASSTYPINLDSATTRGIELNSSVALAERWSLRMNYTYTSSKQKSNGMDDGPLSDTAKHMGNATLRWDATEQFSVWLQGEYRGKSRRFDGDPSGYTGDDLLEYQALGDLKGYTLVNLGGQYRVNKNLSLNATIYNLLDKNFLTCKEWTDSSGNTVCGTPYSKSFRATKGTVPSTGRTFWVSANVTF